MRNLTEIRKKIIDKSGVNGIFYPMETAVEDINDIYKQMYFKAAENGKGIKREIELFTIADEDDVILIRTIPFETILKVEFKAEGLLEWVCLDRTKDCDGAPCSAVWDIDYDFNDKEIMIRKSRAGELKITYPKTTFIPLEDIVDKNTPTLISTDFEDLLWLKPTIEQVAFHKPERLEYFVNEYKALWTDFLKHYTSKNIRQIVSFQDNFRR